MPNLRRAAPATIPAPATVLCAVLAASLAGYAGGPIQPVAAQSHLDAVLGQMNAASAKFQNAQADVQKQQFEKIVNDTTIESGKIYFLRSGGGTQVGAKFDGPTDHAQPYNDPPLQVLNYKDGKFRLYNAGTNHIQEGSASGANQATFETFLTLGFGGSGTDLAKAWTITDKGAEQMSDGSKPVTVEQLDLVSKDPGVQRNYSHITIWIDPVRDISLQQKFFTPSGDTNTAIYTNIVLNGKIDTAAFTIKCKGKCS